MKTRIILLVAAALALVAAPGAKAQDSGALVDALVKKGVLTSQEGEEIRADLTKEFATTSAGKLNVGSYVTQLKLYGDARLRYEYDRQQYPVGTAANGGTGAGIANGDTRVRERNRNRYRLRIGAQYTFADNFMGDFRLATGQGRNSTNSDFGTGNANLGANDTIYADLVYLKYSNAFGQDWLTLTAGRQPLSQNIVQGWTWDSDINPDGGLIKLGDFKPFDNFTVGSTHGTYVWLDYTDNPDTVGGTGKDDVWLMVNQIDMSYKFSKDWNLRVSPGFVNAMGDSSSGGSGMAGNTAPTTTQDLKDMNVFFIDAALSTPFFFENSKGKLYAEYGVNLTGGERAERYNNSINEVDGRNQFWLAGYNVAIGKGKGAWSFDTTYAYYEAYSWSPVLIDSDWNGGMLNGHGFGVKVGYNVTDNVTVSANYRASWAIDNNMTVASVNAAGGTRVSNTDLLQLDLVWKF